MKEADNLWNKMGWLACAILIVLLGTIWFQKTQLNRLTELANAQDKLIETLVAKNDQCLTIKQLRYYDVKYNVYMDSLNYGPRKHRERYADSVRTFGEILRQQ